METRIKTQREHSEGAVSWAAAKADAISPKIAANLQSAFRATGLHPFDPDVALKKLPSDKSDSGRAIDNSLLEYLRETRGFNQGQDRQRRGKKIAVNPGSQIILPDNSNRVSNQSQTPPECSTDTVPKTKGNKRIRKAQDLHESSVSSEDIPLNIVASCSASKKKTGKKQATKQVDVEHNNLCSVCKCDFRFYRHKYEWICCVTCKKWVCGVCNKGSKLAFYECERCEDE